MRLSFDIHFINGFFLVHLIGLTAKPKNALSIGSYQLDLHVTSLTVVNVLGPRVEIGNVPPPVAAPVPLISDLSVGVHNGMELGTFCLIYLVNIFF